MKLETERLFLRPIQIEDVATLSTLWTDPEVTRFMGGPRNYQELYKSLLEDVHARPQPKFDLWPVIEKTSRQVVGDCGIIDKEVDGSVEFELTYVLARSAWGKGYATEIATAIKDNAFKHLGLKRIIALIDPMNPASARVATKVGLLHEKDTVRPNGKTMQVFALSKDDIIASSIKEL
jgi:RimJ/RimL family protein N-acetyltransferase